MGSPKGHAFRGTLWVSSLALYTEPLSKEVMVNRCTRTENLTVQRRRSDAANDLGNAQVLCPECSAAMSMRATHWPPFTDRTRETALSLAGNRCECTRPGNCH